MQRMNRSANAPLGMAFLFLFLAAIPVSLKAVGINVNFSPRLGAVTDAWGQIAGVFSGGHQSNQAAEIMALNNSTCPEVDRSNDPASQPTLIASLNQADGVEVFELALSDSQPEAELKARASATCEKPKARSSRAAKRARADSPRPPHHSIEINVDALKAIKMLKPNFSNDRELWKKIEQEMMKSRYEVKKAFHRVRMSDSPGVVVEVTPTKSSECDKSKETPARFDGEAIKRTLPARAISPRARESRNSEAE